MPFERFTRHLAAQAAAPLVTIQRRGIFSLNEAAFQALGTPEAVQFFFDRERQLVGLASASASDEDSVQVRTTNNNGTTHIVTGARFTSHYDIPTDRGRRFPARLKDGLLIIDLRQEEPVGPITASLGKGPL